MNCVVWFQLAKLLILHSPFMEKVKLRLFGLDVEDVAEDIRKHNGWFYKLVNTAGVRFCSIHMHLMEKYYSIGGNLSEKDMEQLAST